MADQFLAFDLGAESGRALLGDLDGQKLSFKQLHRFSNPAGRMNGQLQWNLLGQWEQLKEGLRIAASSAVAGNSLRGIGVDTWGVDFGLLDPQGAILGNPVQYRDSRTNGVMDRVFARLPREKVYAATGTSPMQFNTLYQLMALQETNPDLLNSAQTLLFMPDLFNFLFTGKRTSEFSIASTSQMYDMPKQRWATGLLEALGLPARILPNVLPSGTLLGSLRPDVAEECAIEEVPVIAPAGHDTGCAVAATPAQGDSWCYISSGTWSLMGVEQRQPIITQASLKYGYTNEGGVGGSVRFLRNIMGLWLVQECRRYWLKQGNDHSYAQLSEMARCADSSALINPDHQPFLSPGKMIPKIDEFCRTTRQSSPAMPGEYVRSCLESLALAYRRTLTGLEEILGRRIQVIHIVGGGSQNELLNQMTADACGRPVVAGPVEATAIGNLLIQAMAVGVVSSLEQARAIVRESVEVKLYEPRDTQKWDRMYERFAQIVNAGSR